MGEASTPQKTRVSEKQRLAMLPPVSASGIPAITMVAKVEANNKKTRIKRNIRAPRSATVSVS